MSQEKLFAQGWKDYELIDAGGGKKLERWGDIITIRPEVNAYFKSEITFVDWEKRANWEFVSKGGQKGVWKALKPNSPKEWTIKFNDLTLNLALTKFKHVGLFPEQNINWQFIQERIRKEDKFLNLFAYTGAASVVAKSLNAEVLHVDSVKHLISWAKSNMESNALDGIKWVHEDALKFIGREEKRKKTYQGLVMDPPAWGVGAKNEKWKLEDKLNDLTISAASILDKKGCLVLNTYSPKVNIGYLKKLASVHFPKRKVEVQELWMKTTTGKNLYYGNVLRVG